ncbi:hypothetical protein BP5796_03949 [Coleophoma crateriformis]|uniref:RTA1-domain-containing protein n=1 Tax=Coleophoma crateriformis TaxID=565419 RepID=A0A3D8SHI9_9HELO|nr:hypothetical protein BP5796_03949 [Coleophoma crateriformis]
MASPSPASAQSATSTQTSSATASCVTVTPGKNGYVPNDACNAEWNYNLSFAAALFFTILFGITTAVHIFQAFIHQKVKMSWVIIMGTAWEFISFLFRTLGAKNQQSLAFAFISQIFVLLAPLWVNAFLYMVLGRMVYFFIPSKRLWRIKATSITKIFVWLDVASFITQVAGGLMISPGNASNQILIGIHVYMGGIGFQEFCILIFIALCTKFYLMKREEERELSDSPNRIIETSPSQGRSWRQLIWAIYAALALITVRIIFRMIEFASGLDPSKNPIPFHEAYFYALDAAVMLLACVVMNIVHPGRILVGEGSEFPKGPTRKEKKEAKRIKKMEKKAAKEKNLAMRLETDGSEEHSLAYNMV